MAVFAVLVVTAAVQTSRNSVSDEQRATRAGRPGRAAPAPSSTASARRLTRLQRETAALQATPARATTPSAQGLLDRLDLLRRARPARSPVRGPGVRVVADDAPGATTARNEVLDTDLQKLVNGLWEAGAEAISLNGQRLTNLSTIRQAGGAITVNAHSLRRAVRRLGDRRQGHAAGTFRGNHERSGMVGPAAPGRAAADDHARGLAPASRRGGRPSATPTRSHQEAPP